MFIAVYTHDSKNYCQDKFFHALLEATPASTINIVDNSETNANLLTIGKIANFNLLHHLTTPAEPKRSKFHRNVFKSVNYLRDKFLQTNEQLFCIVESDVIVEPLTLSKLEVNLLQDIEDPKRGAIGAIYYAGFHDYSKTGIQQTNHVLSGCTIYLRELIEKYPFRYDENNLIPFPDAWICYDAGKEYNFYNNHDIILEHAHNVDGTRYAK